MKNYKIYFLVSILIIILLYISLAYINYINEKKLQLQKNIYITEAKEMKQKASEMIYAKEKATVAIALSLANDKSLLSYIKQSKIPNKYYQHVIQQYKENTRYKNIWIQIVDQNLNSLYRSWTPRKYDNLKTIRKDLLTTLRDNKVTYGISADRYDLSIKGMVPLLENGKVLGVIETISHFNSIAQQMRSFNVESVILLNKENTKRLQYPFTDIFVNGYYVANFNAPKDFIEHLKRDGVRKHIMNDTPYIIEDGMLITSIKLRCIHNKVLGNYILVKKLSDISSTGVDFLFFKLLVFGIIIVMVLAGVVNMIMLFFIRKQKVYYKDIMNAATNIILINNQKTIVDVNKVFFRYFQKYQSLDAFKKEHRCISDFFEEEGEYLHTKIDELHWVEFLLKEESGNNIVKIKIENKIYYFSVSASPIAKQKDICSIVFTDITKQENYKHTLEKLSLTDTLTGIGNRRYYQQKIEEEIARARRYDHSLSLIMFDIDYFKKINDMYGHDVGDMVLKEYTLLIKSLIRNGDVFCRIGGEEFMIILPHATQASALKIAEKLRINVATYKTKVSITMSFGVIEYKKDDNCNELYIRVDKALYKAKESGRDRVVAG